MEQPCDKTKSLWESQYGRLGSFLIASSFLVAAFIQLVTADKQISILLVHAIAALGWFLATLYTFMNLWLIMPSWIPKWISGNESTSTPPQLMHIWIIPLAFVAFWSVVWCDYTKLCWTIPFYSFLGFTLAFYIFQRCLRKWLKL